MRDIIRWVSEARPDKDIGVAMTHYRVARGEIRATNGKITVGHPWPDPDAAFLVSGLEFEKVLARIGDEESTVTVDDLTSSAVTVRSPRFTATIATLPVDSWAYPGVDGAEWRVVPGGLVDILKSLRAFINDNPVHAWAGCVALEDGNCYATNNIAVAGAACDVGNVRALLPSYAIDFLLRREDDLEEWAHNDNYVAFRWGSGAWMRSQLVEGRFPERAAELVRSAYDSEPTQEITDEFREAFADVAGLAEDTIRIYADRLVSRFKRSEVVARCECEVPLVDSTGIALKDKRSSTNIADIAPLCSIWGAAVLRPVIEQATRWQPSMWPKPAPFRGDNVAGFVVGRKE